MNIFNILKTLPLLLILINVNSFGASHTLISGNKHATHKSIENTALKTNKEPVDLPDPSKATKRSLANISANTCKSIAGKNSMPVRAVAVPAGISIASNSITAKAAHSYTTDINGILYVKKGATGTGDSWNNAMGELADALLFAKNNNAVATNQQVKQIWVAGGTYKPLYSADDNNLGNPDNYKNTFLMVKDVALYGGFSGNETTLAQRNLEIIANKSILSGTVYHILVSVNDVGSALIDGFTISKGKEGPLASSTIGGKYILSLHGGGIFNYTSSPSISNCNFLLNIVDGLGGAIYNQNSSPNITNCNFTLNRAQHAAAIFNSVSSPIIFNCKFSENSSDNMGGAMANIDGSSPKIYNSLFANNKSSAYNGGAIWHDGGNYALLINCNLYGNTVNGINGGALNTTRGKISVYNSLLWDNQPKQYFEQTPIPFKNSLIQGNTNTSNGNLNAINIGTSQIFNDAPNKDFTLKLGSPAINTGDNDLYNDNGGNLTTNRDLGKNPRLKDSSIDIGPYEAWPKPQSITATDMTKTYGDIAFIPTATASSGLEVTYASADNSIAEAFQDSGNGNKWKLKIKKAGVVNITAKQAGNGIYNPANDVIFKLTINKAPVAITADAKSKESGAADPVLTYTTNGLLNGDTPQTTFFGTLQRTIGEAAGTYPITQGTLAAANYTISYTGADFTITNAPGDFITVWDMTKVSTGTNISINITTLPSPNNKVRYFWTAPDGSYNNGTVTTSGSHVITTIPANKPRITLHIKPENLASVVIYNDPRIIDVAQWGTAEWRTMQSAFLVCPNLNITATDIPDLRRVTDMRNMFADCSSLNGPANIGSWNTSNVTNMIQLFGRATRFNQDISNWDTQNVTTMAYMFREARAFNQNIGNWNTEKVTDMEAMFDNASVFNQDISNWNTANVTNMSKMFSSAPVFNQNIGKWNTSKVTNMEYMFQYTGAFNGDISSWNTANVTNMWGMFYSTGAFNQNIGNWDTSNVTYMGGMFWNAQAFNQDISSWNTSKVTSMAYMFADSRAFNKDIGNWNTSNVTDMAYMFRANQAFNKDIGNWNTSKVTNMAYMFYGASLFNQNIGGWQLNPAVNMTHMLSYSRMDCQNYSFTLQGWANNPNTPSGRTLGVMGKQYGTNALAARTVLTGTKGWIITGDSPSGQSCRLSQTITATDMVKIYGDGAFVPMATASSNLEVSYTSADNNIAEAFQDTADGNKWKIKIKKAGQVNIFAKQAGNETYNPATNVIFKLTINKAALTVTANALSKEYGTIDPVLTYTTTGLVNSDDQTALRGTLSRAAGEATGAYAITQGTLDAENYTIAYTAANFTITAATGDFVTVWDMSKPDEWGVISNNNIRFYPTISPGQSVDYFWKASGGSSGSGTIAAGTYEVNISGLPANEIITLNLKPDNLKAIKIRDLQLNPERLKLIDVTQWGTAQWSTMKNAFMDCYNLNITATDVPDLSNIADMSRMFQGCRSLNGPANIGTWNTANVTNMFYLFFGTSIFNQNVGAWNTSNVTNMGGMFQGASLFNQNIGSWNTQNVTNMSTMFSDARTFNQPIGNWNTANVINMSSMFSEARAFNQPIGNWNTANVTDMSSMFREARAFNQDITDWNTANVTNMYSMFNNARTFNQDIGRWNTANVNYMFSMFSNAHAFNHNINSWNTSNVIHMGNMFYGTQVFNQDISGWDTQKVTDMSGMFNYAQAFNQNIGNWNTTNVINMSHMFSGNRTFNKDISNWDTQKVTDMSRMFYDAQAFNQNIGSWQLHPVVNMSNMLDNSGMDCQNYSFTLQGWAANPNTPSGRVLGAVGRQYGTNAEAARTVLTNTKGWTITGDSPSGQSCGLDQTITASDMVKTYGEAPFVPTATASSGLEVGYVSADNSIAEAFQDSADDNKWKIKIKKSGVVNITTKQAGNATYNPAADVVFKLTINKAALVVTANALSKEYGTTDPALTYTATGFVNNDDQTELIGTLSRAAGEAVGSYAILQGTLATTANYNIVFTSADFTITKATLNILADAKSKVYGTADPALTYTVTGLANGDDQSIITGSLSRVSGENIGTYAIEQGTLAATANYDLVYTTADFTITKATLNIVAEAKTKVYGSVDPALTYTVTGLANGDDQSIITGALTRVAGEAVGTYNIEQGTLATTANYDITYTAADFNITKATLNIVADAKSKVYGTADPALTYTVTGFENGDDHSIITGALTRVTGEAVGTYNIEQGTLGTTANYDITYTGADFNITKATLNIVADAKSKVYGTADPALTYTVTGFENGDDQSIITGNLTRVAGENIGTYAIEQGTLATTANYDITYTGADFDITKATLNIVADAKSKVYGLADPALTYTVTGLANGDDQSIITGALTRVAGEAVGTYSIEQGTLATTANYDITYTAADFNITKATLNIVADAKSKVFGSADPALTYTVTGFENGDDQSIITGALSRTAGEAVGTYYIGQGMLATNANYNITYTGADFNITKATLNIVADAKSKVYGSVDPALTYTVTGFENGDDQSIITGALTRVTGEEVGTYNIEQGTLATTANYDITYTAADFNITKATLNIVAEAKSKVYGTTDPALTYTVTGFENGDDQSIIIGALSRTAGENIGTYAIEQGTLATTANYDIVYTGADFDITKATLNIVAEAKTKVYGSADPALTYTVTGFENGDDQSIITGALTRVAGEAVGTYEIQQGTLATTANYDITYTAADFDITKATLNIVAEAKSKVYGTTDPALTYTVTGFENGDDQSIITGNLTRVAGENIGTYAIEQGTLATTANYDIVYTGADLTITKATLNILADVKTKVYGSADPALTYTVTGLANGDDQSVITGALTRVAGENIGTYAIEQGTLATTANYDIVYTAADFTITKATLNIVADAKSKVYGSADPALTYTVTGFANGDDQSILTGALSRTAGENIGTYAIEQGTLMTSANYNITYTGADFTITKATLNIVAEAKSKVYGTTDPALTYTITGFENGDDQSIITGSLSRVSGENIGTYAIEQGTLATTANYDITYAGADFDITKATLNIVADAKSKVYGSTDPALTYTVTEFANGDDQSVITGALTRVSGENIGTYAIEQGTLTTTANYDITYTGADFNITKATLNIVAEAKSKVYGTTDPALTYTVTGFENGDDQSIITGSLSRVSGENIGTYAIEQGTLATTANYDITYTGADFTITKATLSIVADAKSKVYGTSDPALTYTVTGFANNDDQSIITGNLARVVGEEAGIYPIEQGTLSAGANYHITYTGADFTITGGTLLIIANPKSKVYGTADPVLTYTVTGFVNGDDQSIIEGTLSRVAGEQAGNYTIKQGTLSAKGYIIKYTEAPFVISKAKLKIVADDKTKFYGTTDPALTYKVTGLVNGDNPSVVKGSLTRTAGEAVGTYIIRQGTLEAGTNYDINFTQAEFVISKITLYTISLHDATFTYDGSRKSILISGDLPAGVTVTYTGNGQTNAGSYIVTADIDGGSNYNSLSLQATLKINKAKQIITFKEIVPVYRDAGTVKLDISSNSSLPIKIYSDNKLVAEVTGDQEVTVRGVGLALITAEQSGNDNYIAAEPVIRQLRVRNEEGAKLPLRVHKAVSPNGDGINEYLRIEGIDEYPDNQIVIFDANGNLIQKIRGYVNETNCFNGIKASRKVPSGTYFYVLEVKIDDKWQHEKGFFVVRY
ncbi:MBG domain-containing protein [Sphingobacterium spiritivorum]|uniref:MBG domain-containing protein n=1 Tax=Sphingobacterium spiritivorum TaxID=258 RepID=UPI003DA5663B